MNAYDMKFDEEEAVLPGFRFHPTDEELVDFYLKRKVENKKLSIELIKEIDIYRHEPWELPSMTSVGADEHEWYFFCLRGRKYRNSVRPNRVTGSGFWKATGIDKPICSFKAPHNCIGLKKSLVYYRGSAGKGSKTDWMMHEFRLPPQPRNSTGQQHNNLSRTINTTLEAEVWTLCRIFKRVTTYKKYIPPQSNLSFNSSQAESSSKTSSNESDHKNDNKRKSEIYFGMADHTLIGQQSNHYLTINNSDHRQTWSDPLASSSSGLWNASGEMMFDDCSEWDELRHVVDPYDVV